MSVGIDMNYKLEDIMLEVLNEIESIVKVAGGRGLGTGKVYPNRSQKPGYGETSEKEKKEKYILKPVKISKAFKRKVKSGR